MSPIWFTIIYTIGVIVGICILVLGVKRYWRKQHEIGLASKRALVNFEILPEDLKLCLIFLQQQNRRKFTDRYHAKLRNLVELGLLEVSGEREAATVFEIPLGVWFAMNDEVWGQGYPKIEREPWLPSIF
jgi:hypothetical protein